MALFAAIQQQNSAEALALITAKANVNVSDCVGNTPLIRAFKEELNEVVLALISAGADVNVRDHVGYRPLNTSLMVACKRKLNEVALALISAGADVNEGDRAGDTPLIIACKGKLNEVALILAKSDHLIYIQKYSTLTNDINVQKALSFNFSQHPNRYEFSLADIHLLNPRNFKRIKTMMLIRNQPNNPLHILPIELMELLFTNLFS